jgi:hypothetical protein
MIGGSTPRARADSKYPDGVMDRTEPSEGFSPGSNPGRDTFDELYGLRVCRSARQFTELQDGVRFLGGLLIFNAGTRRLGNWLDFMFDVATIGNRSNIINSRT